MDEESERGYLRHRATLFLPCMAVGRDDDEAPVCRALERDPLSLAVAVHGRCRSKKVQITAGPFGSLGAGPNNRG